MPVVYDSFKDTAVTSLEVTPANTYLFYVYGAGGGGGGTGGGKGSAGTFVSGKFKPTAKFTIYFTKGTGGAAGDGSSTGGSAGGASTVISADSGATLSIIAGSGAGGNTSASSVKDAVAGSLTGNKKNLYGAETITASSGFGQGGAGSVKGTNGTSTAAAVGGYSFAGGTAIAGSVSYKTIPTSLDVGLGGSATSAGQDGYIYITTEDKENAQGIPLTASGVVAIVSSQVINQAKIAAIAAKVALDKIIEALESADKISSNTNSGTQTVDADGNPVFIINDNVNDDIYTLTYIYPGFKVIKTDKTGIKTTLGSIPFDIDATTNTTVSLLLSSSLLTLVYVKLTKKLTITLAGIVVKTSADSLQKNVNLNAAADAVTNTQAKVDSITALYSTATVRVAQVNAAYNTLAQTAADNIATSLTSATEQLNLAKTADASAKTAAAAAEAKILQNSYITDLEWQMAKTAAGSAAAKPFADAAAAAYVAADNFYKTAKTNSDTLDNYVLWSQPVDDTSQAALDAADEATDAANAATDAANAAAEAADAATAAVQDVANAVAAALTQVSDMVKALKTQITSITNLVIKLQKKVKA